MNEATQIFGIIFQGVMNILFHYESTKVYTGKGQDVQKMGKHLYKQRGCNHPKTYFNLRVKLPESQHGEWIRKSCSGTWDKSSFAEEKQNVTIHTLVPSTLVEIRHLSKNKRETRSLLDTNLYWMHRFALPGTRYQTTPPLKVSCPPPKQDTVRLFILMLRKFCSSKCVVWGPFETPIIQCSKNLVMYR